MNSSGTMKSGACSNPFTLGKCADSAMRHSVSNVSASPAPLLSTEIQAALPHPHTNIFVFYSPTLRMGETILFPTLRKIGRSEEAVKERTTLAQQRRTCIRDWLESG